MSGAITPRLDAAADELIAGMLDGTIRARGGKPFRASVARLYRQLLDAYIVRELGARRLADISHPDLLDLADRLAARGLAPSTIRNALDPVRVIMRRAVSRGALDANPAAGLELPAALVEALPTTRDRALWACAFYAGIRGGEIRALRWRHVDLAAARLSIAEAMDDKRATTAPKTRAGTRSVPITPHLRRHLVALRAESTGAPDAYVFGAADDRAFAQTTIYKRARKAWAAAGLQPITLHEARHTCISTWIMAGVNLKNRRGNGRPRVDLDHARPLRAPPPWSGRRGDGPCREIPGRRAVSVNGSYTVHINYPVGSRTRSAPFETLDEARMYHAERLEQIAG